MNTERTEKFVNAIACDLEEGGFRQVSGTMLRRTLATAVSAALPLLADTGIPASQPAELAERQGKGRERFEAWATSKGLNTVRSSEEIDRYAHTDTFYAWQGYQAAIATTGKQQVVEVQGDPHTEEMDEIHQIAFEIGGDDEGGYQFTAEDLEQFVRTLASRQPGAQGIDLGQLLEPIKEAVHTALSAHMMGISHAKRESVAVHVARLLRDGQRDAAPGVG